MQRMWWTGLIAKQQSQESVQCEKQETKWSPDDDEEGDISGAYNALSLYCYKLYIQNGQ